jgi:antitoxin HicB
MNSKKTDPRKNAIEQAAQAPVSFKQMLAYQIEREMALQGVSRVKMAELMLTSRAVVNRLLDPANPSVTLQTVQKAADVLKKEWHIFLQER